MGSLETFSFIFRPLNEQNNRKVWGMLRWDNTVKPAFSGLANLTAQLAGTRSMGQLDMGDFNEAYLFEHSDGGQTLVLWSTRPAAYQPMSVQLNPAALAPLPLPAHTAILNLMGTRLKTFSRPGPMPVYITGVRGLKPDFLAPEALSLAHPAPPTTILRFVPGEGFKMRRSPIVPPRVGQPGPGGGPNRNIILDGTAGDAVAEVFNFSDRPVRGALRSLGKGYEVTGLNAAVKVPPKSSVKIPLKITVQKGATGLQFGGTFAGRPIAPILIPVSAAPPATEMQ
jgi:hypothetical protein